MIGVKSAIHNFSSIISENEMKKKNKRKKNEKQISEISHIDLVT